MPQKKRFEIVQKDNGENKMAPLDVPILD